MAKKREVEKHEVADGHVLMMADEHAAGVTVEGVSYVPAEDGTVEVPVEHAELLTSHGFSRITAPEAEANDDGEGEE